MDIELPAQQEPSAVLHCLTTIPAQWIIDWEKVTDDEVLLRVLQQECRVRLDPECLQFDRLRQYCKRVSPMVLQFETRE